MPPSLALLLTGALVVWLFLRDEGRKHEVSWALWLPLGWLFITGTRFVSQWVALGQWAGPTTSEDGSPVDAIVFGVFTLAGMVVLARRRVDVVALARQNAWIVALLAYGLLSIAWSDLPFVSLKRWIKALGNPIMALIILTDPDPARAFRVAMRRLAYLGLPLSVTFIKYFPEYGRGFDGWTGAATNQGAALTKNGLGVLCLVTGLALVWNLQVLRRILASRGRSLEWWVTVGLLGMVGWLLFMSDSKTSQVTLLLGVLTLAALRKSEALRNRFVGYLIAAIIVGVVVESSFDVYEQILRALGRDPDLTDRTEVWADVLAMQPNVLLGAGYEAFWLGDRLAEMWRIWWWQPNQAHNGYIEMYANGGLVGLGLLLGMILSAFFHVARDLRSQSEDQIEWARLRMAMLLVIVTYNYTEATFKGVSVMWTLFYVVAWSVDSRVRVATHRWRASPANAPEAGAARTSAGRSRPSRQGVRPWSSRSRRT